MNKLTQNPQVQQLSLIAARQIAAIKHVKPLTDSEWKELFEAEKVLKNAGELITATYDED